MKCTEKDSLEGQRDRIKKDVARNRVIMAALLVIL